MTKKFLRISDVVQLCGLPRSTIYEKMAAGEFPLQVRLSARAGNLARAGARPPDLSI
jgi:prophage regulatory protein